MDSGDDTVDLEAAELRSAVRKRLFGEDEPVRIGRYRLDRALGRGGMGIVYAAFDPQLGRNVALKVLRPGARGKDPLEERNARLLREARAMAQLAHPNVVSVFESGAEGDRVFVAMELIKGMTLKRWLAAESRSLPEILAVFVAAGRGLAAAHEAGLVHRDFKPDNVMVGPGTRVRVLDFGLARAATDTQGPDSLDTISASANGDSLTETGTVLGTPAYMAPEQRRRESAGPASDQYSYCVALHEALLGRRPSDEPGDTTRSAIPRAVRKAVSRGLADDPRERWPSMAALVDLLERKLSRRRPWGWIAAGGLTLTLGGTAAALALHPTNEAVSCADAGEAAARLVAEDRMEAIEAVAASSPTFARTSWDKTHARLEFIAQRWAGASVENCTATFEDGAQSQSDYLWRGRCLDASLREVETIVELLGEPDAVGFEHAANAVASIDPAIDCDAARATRVPVESPDPKRRAEVDRVRGELARARGVMGTGRYAEAETIAAEAVSAAEAVGYGPLVAEALLLRGRAQASSGRSEDASDTFNAAIEAAETHHHDEITAEAWTALISTMAADLGQLDAAERLLAPAKGAVGRLGEAPVLEGRLEQAECTLRQSQGRLDEAIELARSALATYESVLPPEHPRVTSALHDVAKSLRAKGEFEASLEPAQRALELTERRVPATHPDVSAPLTALGSAHGAMGDHEAALAHFERSATIIEAALGPEHPRLAAAKHNVGNALAALRRFDEAFEALSVANAIDTKTLGASNPHRTASLYALGMVQRYRGNTDEAQALLEEALDVLERAWGPEHPKLAYVLVGLGNVCAQREDYPQAIEYFTRVRTLLSKTLGARHPRIVHATVGSGLAHLELGKAATAATLFEEALSIAAEFPSDPLEAAEAEFGLAKALRVQDPDNSRSTSLAASARETFAAAGERGTEVVADIDAWSSAG